MKDPLKHISFFYCLLERDKDRVSCFKRNLMNFPFIEKFPAVNGYDPKETVEEMLKNGIKFNAESLKFSKSWTNPKGEKIIEPERDAGTFGTLANWITKFKCIKHQVDNQLPYMCIIEDDLILKPSFLPMVIDCVEDLKSNPKKTHARISAWGECFIFSLEGAKHTLKTLMDIGFKNPIGRQLSNIDPFRKKCMRKRHASIRRGVKDKPYILRTEKHKGNCVDKTLRFSDLNLKSHEDFDVFYLNSMRVLESQIKEEKISFIEDLKNYNE